ncbi:hypothetical protein [Cytobacillus oceanisediminis]|uniref:Lipoprotein n=1 Tax=Cytobacillus oceanisediminis TaxID=665099 RepID=A0ABX3CL83_9BACI|nr:hypothetical protein [Cytobacillus oceanisediminis]OHX42906.1 hypothetical protein BBV17_26675 [Cytobacillus oceanisediminis]
MRNIIKLCILMTTLILLILGCSQSEIKYYSNPNVLTLQEINDIAEIGDYQLSIVDGKLIINAKNKEFEVSLPDNYSGIQSFHFSYDKRFLAYDVMVKNGVKIFVVNLETGEKINLSETIGYLYDYDGYQSPFGIAWAPNKNLIAIIGGYNDSARIDLYHLEMEKGKQAPGGSLIFKDVYGVKWDSTGESIYYLVDSLENENMYKLYQTEIESNSYLLGGTVSVITEINEEGFNNWFNKEE